MASEEEIRMYIRDDKFHMVTYEDLQKELERLDEKHRRYMTVFNEETMRTVKKINQLKSHLNQLDILKSKK
jgi:virulence-associated protein VapD